MEAPERIYLQTGLTEWDEDEPWLTDGVTWCVDRINDSDVEYVRRDVAVKLRAALEQKLGYPFGASILTGGHKLLAETAWLAEDAESGEESEA